MRFELLLLSISTKSWLYQECEKARRLIECTECSLPLIVVEIQVLESNAAQEALQYQRNSLLWPMTIPGPECRLQGTGCQLPQRHMISD